MLSLDKEYVGDYCQSVFGSDCAFRPFTFTQGYSPNWEIPQIKLDQYLGIISVSHVPLRSYGSVIVLTSGSLTVDCSKCADSLYFQQYYATNTFTITFGSSSDLSLVGAGGTRLTNVFFIPVGAILTGNGVISQLRYQGAVTAYYNTLNGITVMPRSESLYIGEIQSNSYSCISGPDNLPIFTTITQSYLSGVFDSLLCYSAPGTYFVSFMGYKITKYASFKSQVNYFTKIAS